MGSLAVLGGTFDPVHHGHLRSAIEVKYRLGVDEVRLLPCHTPPHRNPPGASAQQRLEMLRLAVASQPGMRIDEREIKRGGPSYMVDTLRSFRADLQDGPLVLVLGLDSFLTLPEWRAWRELVDLAHIVVLDRPGYQASLPPVLRDWSDERWVDDPVVLVGAPAGHLMYFSATQMDVSATAIRRMVETGEPIGFLTPRCVVDYIEATGLYQQEVTRVDAK